MHTRLPPVQGHLPMRSGGQNTVAGGHHHYTGQRGSGPQNRYVQPGNRGSTGGSYNQNRGGSLSGFGPVPGGNYGSAPLSGPPGRGNNPGGYGQGGASYSGNTSGRGPNIPSSGRSQPYT